MLQKSLLSVSNYDEREIEEIGDYKDPFAKHYSFPRLFVIKPSGEGYELQSRE